MENLTENKKHFGELLEIVLRLKKELNESYLILKSDFNPLENIDAFNDKRKILNELTLKLREFVLVEQDKKGEELADIKNRIRAEIFEIININGAFSGLIKKNIYYNQLTISFITDIFHKNSIYNKVGETNSNFSPLKNVLMGSGLKI
ncbi:MAG: hypothetical protein EVJ47_05055 [Candidatus Acidulodesulfobacterium ferriphilum]|uniref:Uncharacterized protein n=1 Tax=Candidatus Acidulodesulfobacterium ferriphilum TaxID=2597223 RepID=A0A519BB87_9DELT|nr:MAG: hypothetical protein EVJ47_05055 [Candidatus Acidulodesulfobacterium ferriphilum]